MIAGGEVFGALVRALRPYANDIVYVGGWVHALYLLRAEGPTARTVMTGDVDLTLPGNLPAGRRPPLVELIRQAGFQVQPYDEASGLLEIYLGGMDLDLLTEAPSPRETVRIQGQSDLHVQGYPFQAMLRESSHVMLVGDEVDPAMVQPVEILIPTLPAYTVGKLLSMPLRTSRGKQAKDLVYVSEILARDQLREEVARGVHHLGEQYPREVREAGENLGRAIKDRTLVAAAARQLIEGSGYGLADPSPVRAGLLARLRRFHGECWA